MEGDRPRRPRRTTAAAATAVVVGLVLAACSGDDSDSGGAGEGSGRGTATSAPADLQTPDLPEIEGPVTGPGAMYVDPLEAGFPPGDRAEASGYAFEEYFASGTAAGQPYRVRVQLARPGDDAAEPFSGHAIVEAIHPQGIPFVWNFTRDYLMARGHAAVNISLFPNTVETLRDANAERYADLNVVADEANANSGIAFEHASDIYAQVGSWLKSDEAPLPGLEWLHMTGHSMSVGPVWQYMDSHHDRYRLEDGDPIYAGFFPETTRTASRMGPFPEVDVPTVLINSELEVEEVLVADGIDYRRPDSDEPGEQFRLYEVAGMPHNPSWMHPLLEGLDIASTAEQRCANPLNSFPYNPTISMALDHLLRWVEDGTAPPRAEPIELTGEPGDDGIAIVRDEHGNAVGGVRSATVDVPVATHQALNEPRDPNQDLTPGSCLVYGSQLDFSPEELESLYAAQDDYVDQVEDRIDELIEEGWVLEQFADELQQRAENFEGFRQD